MTSGECALARKIIGARGCDELGWRNCDSAGHTGDMMGMI